MNLDQLTGTDLDRRLAELLEPLHKYEADLTLWAVMDGSFIRSPEGAWECICVYDDGDEPRWVPRAFSSDWAAMGFLFDQLWERGLSLNLFDAIPKFSSVFYPRVHGKLIVTVARAACKALEKEAETKVAA